MAVSAQQVKAAGTVAQPPETDTAIATKLNAWCQRLEAAGTACTAAALHSEAPEACVPFPAELGDALPTLWTGLLARMSAEQPVALERFQLHTDPKNPQAAVPHLVMAARFAYGQGQTATLGLCLPPPHHERVVQAVLLALASLQWSLTEHQQTALLRTAKLLEVVGHVGSQDNAHAAAQEWVNRTAAWVRAVAAGTSPDTVPLTLALFDVRGTVPRWWVGSDTAWAQKAAPVVLEATEQAGRAVASLTDVKGEGWWALPVLSQGRAAAVVVAHGNAATLTEEVLLILRSSLSLIEPLLREWRLAERHLPQHAWDATLFAARLLTTTGERGHLAWKLGAAAALAAAVLLLAVPFDERVTAPLAIEGQTRQLVTAPFEGFVAQVKVRPGERVSQGQELLKLETRELLLERARYDSDREQAAVKLRQAMADHDASAVALATTQVQSAKAQLSLVENKLARAVVLAPLSGLVVSGDWAQQIGAPLEVGKQLFEIAAVDQYRVALHVVDHDIGRVHEGQLGELRLAGAPHRAYPFRVALVTATASVQDGSNGFRVEAVWEGAAPPLSPGMQGVGKFTVGRANLLIQWTRSSIDWLRMKWWTWWI
jgi:multidrug efflux pump subunit AcrA (membrane-fusion protein)